MAYKSLKSTGLGCDRCVACSGKISISKGLVILLFICRFVPTPQLKAGEMNSTAIANGHDCSSDRVCHWHASILQFNVLCRLKHLNECFMIYLLVLGNNSSEINSMI